MELTKLSEHLYVPTDFGKHHHYYADAEGTKEYSGITTVLKVLAKPALIPWAAKMTVEFIKPRLVELEDEKYEIIQLEDGEWDAWGDVEGFLKAAQTAHTRKKEEAGAHGTDAHALVEEYINQSIEKNAGKLLPMAEAIGDFESIRPFHNWAWENVDHFLFSERRMAHPELFVAGTADFAYVGKDGRRYVGDFKTSSGLWSEYWYQVAAYTLMLEAEGDEKYDGLALVRLGRDGKFEAHYLYDYETAKKGFLACLELYRTEAAIGSLVVH